MSGENYFDDEGEPCDVCGVGVVNGMSPTTPNGYTLWTCDTCYYEAKTRNWDDDNEELK